MRKRKVTRLIRRRHWLALYKVNKDRFSQPLLGDNFPVFALSKLG